MNIRIKRSIFRKCFLTALLVSLVFLLSACFQQNTVPEPKPSQQPNVFNQYISSQAIEPDLAGLETNLFQNGDFEDTIGWIPCESASDLSIIDDDDRKSRVLRTSADSCFYQSVAIQDLTKLKLSCYALAPSGGLWTGMGLSFSDASWNAVGEELSKVFTDNQNYINKTITNDVPNNAAYASMWFYSAGQARVDDCVLTEVQSTSTPVNQQSCVVNNNNTWKSVLYLPGFGNGEENSDYVAENLYLVQNIDGTAELKGFVKFIDDPNRRFEADIKLSGRTRTSPTGNSTQGWIYYPKYEGRLIGRNTYDGRSITLKYEPSYVGQIGDGANKQNQEFGAHFEMTSTNGGSNKYMEWAMALDCADSSAPENPNPFAGNLSLAGIVFEDIQSDQVYAAGDRAFNNVTIALYSDVNNNGDLDDDDLPLTSVVTSPDGKYEFQNLISGSYLVEVTDMNNVLSNFGTTLSTSAAIALTANKTANFGFRKLSSNLPINTVSTEFPFPAGELGSRSGQYTYNNNTVFIIGSGPSTPNQPRNFNDRIFVYRRTNQGWTYNATILKTNGSIPEPRYNYSRNINSLVASDNMLVATDAQNDAYVFELIANRWIQTAKFIDAGNTAILTNDAILIRNNNDLSVYKKVEGIWTFQRKNNVAEGENRVLSIATDGQSLFLEYSNNDKIIQFSITEQATLQQEATVQLNANTSRSSYSRQIVATANELVIQDYIFDADGRVIDNLVKVFKKANGQWVLKDTLSLPDSIISDGYRWSGFGGSISIRNNQMLIGASSANTYAVPSRDNPDEYVPSGRGALYLYEKINGTWTLKVKLHPKDGRAGNNVALSDYEAISSDGGYSFYVFPLREATNLPTPAVPLPLAKGDINGRIYLDRNQNDQKDIDEEALGNVIVSLYRDSDRNGIFDGDSLIEISKTDNLGRYSFSGLNADAYIVSVAPDNRQADSIRNDFLRSLEASSPSYPAYSIVLAENENREAVNFSFKNRVIDSVISIGDRVWIDGNKNGIQEKGEVGADGIKISLFKADGSLILTTTTTNGRYNFNAQPGRYYIGVNLNPDNLSWNRISNGSFTRANADVNDVLDSDIIPPSGNRVYIAKTEVFTLVEGQSNFDIDVGIHSYSANSERINIFSWKDISLNGLKDEFEPALENISVDLIDDTSGQVISTGRTRTDGFLSFGQSSGVNSEELHLRTDKPYRLRFNLPDIYQASPLADDVSTSRQVGNDLPPNQRELGPFYLTLGNDFGNSYYYYNGNNNPDSFNIGLNNPTKIFSKVQGRVWRDSNANGIQDSGESGIADIELSLRYAQNNVTTSKTIRSDANGNYSFTNLIADDYVISATIPRNYLLSPGEQIADESLDSDLSYQFPSANITLSEGGVLNNFDVGLRPLAKYFEQQKITTSGRYAVDYALAEDNTIVTTSYETQYDSTARQYTYTSYVEVFRNTNNTWSRVKLWEVPYQSYGLDLSANGKVLAISYKFDEETVGLISYELTNGTWTQIPSINAIAKGRYSRPNSHLDETGQYLFVERQTYTAPDRSVVAAGVDVYKRINDLWQLQKTLNPWVDAGFATSTRTPRLAGIDISQGQLAVSVIDITKSSFGEGKVVIYGQNASGTNQWGVQQVLGPQSRYTSALSIFENSLVVVGSRDIYFYTKNSTGRWVLKQTEENVVSPSGGMGSVVSVYRNTFLYTRYSSYKSRISRSIPIVNTISTDRNSWKSIGYLERNDALTTRPSALFIDPQMNCNYIAAKKLYVNQVISIFKNPNSSSCN